MDSSVLELAVVFFLFGLVVGSFLTVVVYRVPRKESVVSPRSRCPGCGRQIAAYDNIPVLSWVLLRGRCRHCSAQISPRYPLTELANGLLWLAASLRFGDELFVAVIMACFFSVLLAVSLIDAEHRIIPNAILYPAVPVFAVLLVAGRLLEAPVDLFGAAVGLLAFGGGMLLVAVIYPKGMGIGDVKLAGFLGLVLGSLGLELVAVAAFLGFMLGAVGGAALMAFAGKGRKTVVPFGPFLAAGAGASVFVGAQIADWYGGFFN